MDNVADIKAKIDKIELTLYGRDGLGGLTACIHEKVTRKTIWAFVVGVFIVAGLPLFLLGGKMWAEQSANPITYAGLPALGALESRVKSLEDKTDRMIDIQTGILTELRRMNEELKKK